MPPFDFGLSIEITKAVFSKYKDLSVRQRVVNAAMRSLVKDSLSEFNKEETFKVLSQINNWTKSQSFLSFWKDALLNGAFDFEKACSTFIEANKFIPLKIDLEKELMPHFLRHLEAHRIEEEKIFLAYRQANPQVAMPQNLNLKPITLTDGSMPSSTAMWQEWYTILRNSELALEKGKINFAFQELKNLSEHEKFDAAEVPLKLAILRGLGEICSKLNETPLALSYLARCIKLDSKDSQTLIALCQLKIGSYEYEDALAYAEQAFYSEPENEMAVASYLLCSSLSGRSSQMFEYLAAHPDKANGKFVLIACGHAWAFENDFEIALSFFERALEHHPCDLPIQFLLASCKLILFQNSDDCVRSTADEEFVTEISSLASRFEMLLENERASDNPSGRNKYILALVATFALIGSWVEGLKVFETWYLTGDDAAIKGLKALVLIHLKELEMARATLAEFDNIEDQNLNITRFILARELDDLDECIRILDKSILDTTISLEAKITNRVAKARILYDLSKPNLALEVIEPLLVLENIPFACKFEMLIVLKLLEQSEQYQKLYASTELSESQQVELISIIAQEYINRQRWLSAASQLKQIPDLEKNYESLALLAKVQAAGGLHAAAASTARKARLLKNEIVADVTESIELPHYINEREWHEALELSKFLRMKQPDEIRHSAGQALIYYYGFEDLKAARSVMAGIDMSRIPNSLRIKLQAIKETVDKNGDQ